METGEKIKTLRKELGLTLEEVGTIVGVGKSTVRKWENGLISNMRSDKIEKLAEALHTTPAYLMGWEKEGTNIFINNFKNTLKFLRVQEGYSQSELAKKLGISKSAISMYEVGKREPDFEILEIIANFFNVDMNYLLCSKKKDTESLSIPTNILKYYNNLNELGKREAEKRMRELTFIPEYTSSGDV